MKQIVRIKFGSHLYGTTTPTSDVDFKTVFLPTGQDILLQRAPAVVLHAREKAHGEKNQPGDVDDEKFSLQRYLGLVADGKPVAMDMLFAPDWAMTDDPNWQWVEIQANRHRLVSKRSGPLVSYMREQCNKYGIKGSRVAAAQAARDFLLIAGLSSSRLATVHAEIHALCEKHEHMALEQEPAPHTGWLWRVCNRAMPLNASIKSAYEVMQRLVDAYGERAKMAASQQGIDWKALSHAVRVGEQALELLGTGHVTFPLPNAAHILDIKQGKLLYQDVAAEIEDLLVRVEAAAVTSTLRDEPDFEWIDRFVAECYRDQVLAA